MCENPDFLNEAKDIEARWSSTGLLDSIIANRKPGQILLESQRLMPAKPLAVIFSGAGLSQESGVPTFRDSDGLWENHKVEDVASQDGWVRNPQLVLDFYAKRMEGCGSVEPNAAHKAIARLQEKYTVVNITQNIDDLLERAGCTNVWHLHGTLSKRKCQHHNEISNLDGDTNFTCDHKADHTVAVTLGEKCPKCAGQMRPDVVWFGEAVDMDAMRIRQYCHDVKYGVDGSEPGVFICVGTSAQVYPAASLIPLFSQVKNKYIVDLKPHRIADYTLVAGKAGEVLPGLVEELLK